MEYNPAIGSRLVQSPSINSTAVAPITVLVVEDDELVRELAVEFLSDAGFQVLEAGNGEEALSLLESNPNIRVLFTDINMPGPLYLAELRLFASLVILKALSSSFVK